MDGLPGVLANPAVFWPLMVLVAAVLVAAILRASSGLLSSGYRGTGEELVGSNGGAARTTNGTTLSHKNT